MRAILSLLLTIFLGSVALAHEGHDHDKPVPLALPVAPRITAVTPDYELVGVRSGNDRLTIFLTTFETGDPVNGASIIVEGNGEQVKAVPRDDGVFDVSAPFLGGASSVDLVFSLTLQDGSQDLLTGQLDPPTPVNKRGEPQAEFGSNMSAVLLGLGGVITGILATLLGLPRRRAPEAQKGLPQNVGAPREKQVGRVAAMLIGGVALTLHGTDARAAEQVAVPSIPATMATDLAQRLPDGTLFVPKATQHLLSVRTMLVQETDIARSAQLTGTVIPAPNNFGRVQAAHSGRLEVPHNGQPYVGQKVHKGDVLGYLIPHIGTVERGTVQSQIAETDARIVMQKNRLTRLHGARLAVPPIKIDEAEGELAGFGGSPPRTKPDALRAPRNYRARVRRNLKGWILRRAGRRAARYTV